MHNANLTATLIVSVVVAALLAVAIRLAFTRAPASQAAPRAPRAPRGYRGAHTPASRPAPLVDEHAPAVTSAAPVGVVSARHAEVPHEGATEGFVYELRALHDMPCSPELERVATTAEMMAVTHDELGEVWRAFTAGLDAVCGSICDRLDPLWFRVDEPTGAYPVVSA